MCISINKAHALGDVVKIDHGYNIDGHIAVVVHTLVVPESTPVTKSMESSNGNIYVDEDDDKALLIIATMIQIPMKMTAT